MFQTDVLPFTAIYLLGDNLDNHKTFQVCLSVDGDSSKGNDAAKMMGATLLEIPCKFVPAFQNLRNNNSRVFCCAYCRSGHHNSKAIRTREMSA